MTYRRAAVASTFSPTFAAVLAEAMRFAARSGASLDVLHASEFDETKAARFREALGDDVVIRWVQGATPAEALMSVTADYELLIAGALQREDGDRPFTSGVARDLLRVSPCDLLLVPRPSEEPVPLSHVVVAMEPGNGRDGFLQRTLEQLNPKRATIAVCQTPFAAAIANSRGEAPTDVDAWLTEITNGLVNSEIEIDERIVSSNTGYNLCDAVEGLAADLLVVRTEADQGGALPGHMDWLYQVIPTRLLVVRDRSAP